MKHTIIITASLAAASVAMSAHATGGLYDYLDEHIAMQGELDATNDRIDSYASQGEQAYHELDGRIDHANGRVDTLESQGRAAYDELRGQDQSAAQDRNDIRHGQEQNTARIDDNATTNAEQTQTLDSHDQRIGTGEEANARQDGTLAQHDGRIDMNRVDIADFRQESNARFDRHSAAIQQNQQDIASLQGEDRNLRAGIAAAVAAASHQFDVSASAGGQLSIAGGYYEGENAASLAFGAPINERLFININASHDSRGNDAYGAGMNVKLW